MSILHYDEPLSDVLAPGQPDAPPPLPQQPPTAQPAESPPGMWDQERDHPWLYAALYGAAIALSLLASHFAARGA